MRRAAFSRYIREPRTVVLYESSHRIEAALEDLVHILGGQRAISIGRELTKRYETFLNGLAGDVLTQLQQDKNQQRGECVLLIQGAEEVDVSDQSILSVLSPLLEEVPPKQAMALTTKITGCRKKQAYNLMLALKQSRGR